MIKIAQLYRAANGSTEPFELDFEAEVFEIPELKGSVKATGKFLRVEEGIMMLVDNLEATQKTICTRCAKPLNLKIPFEPSEWLFYDTPPHEDDGEDERLYMDTHRLEIDEKEPIRQDLLLNLRSHPHCAKNCAHFEESRPEEAPKGVKALASLKDLL